MGFLINLVLWVFFSSSSLRTNGDDEVIDLPACTYSTMYNFGDSNSDTGGIAAAFYPPASPSGETYFGRPVGRASDGRLIVDFIGSNYQNGANFATGGATILRPNGSWFDSGLSPFNLEIQVEHFTQFKDRTAYLYGQFNKELKDEIVKEEQSSLMQPSMLTYAAKYELITNAKNQGFEDPFEICCGYHGIGYDVWCGNKGNVNGTEVYAGSCADPSKIISWDGVHYTEAANHWIANRIVNGSMSDPSIPITSACNARANLSALGLF
ncbi:UNVERIFIED_CONTAM: GDSL esterase/lipase [Sesamum latifolium]|uniref:GDSL esterase/lipase n=1 Tax=Sesamum latifolium TaxID=2727402 RepID=A0AAW2Y7N0_9LAMI